jgi:hypothetical protein
MTTKTMLPTKKKMTRTTIPEELRPYPCVPAFGRTGFVGVITGVSFIALGRVG